MNNTRSAPVAIVVMLSCLLAGMQPLSAAGPSIGGFVPLVGIGLTDEYKTLEDVNLGETFFIADPSDSPGGTALGTGGTAYYDVAILDTGAATHVLTQQAYDGFDIEGAGLDGTETQTIGGATGLIEMQINDAMGVYAAGLGDRTSVSPKLVMNTAALRGQTSFALLSAPTEWELPNIIGLPMAAHHAIAILNDDPQVFQYQGRTVRTPQVELRDLGSGGGEIVRRAPLKLRPGTGFIQGPFYIYNLSMDDIFSGELNLHDNPASPSVIENGGMFVDVDVANNSESLADKEFLFDTGADLTVVSELTAKRLGFDAALDTPDFYLEVQGSGGVQSGVPGIFLDELNIDTIGGSFTLHNVPVAVLDVTNPNDPGNVVDGIIGMNLFNGRNLVIDASPSVGQGGVGPSLYISDPVTETHHWSAVAASASWTASTSWYTAGTPGVLWSTNVGNVSGSDQTAVVSSNSTVFDLTVSGTASADMTVRIDSGATLTTFGETLIQEGGRVELAGGALDTQFVNIEGGTLAGEGEVLAGTGPIRSPVRNLSGRVEPGDPVGQLRIDGDFSNQAGGTLAIDLGGTTAVTQYDQLAVYHYAFLAGTLEVSLADLGGGLFAPSVGNTFTILTAAEGIVGTFDQRVLPTGYQWDVTYGMNSVVLEVIGLGLAGDFNGDGTVDAADYTVWRDHLGDPDESALNGNGDGLSGVDPGDYVLWKSNFGTTSGSGAGTPAAVPEPASCALLIVCALTAALLRVAPPAFGRGSG
jgi:hypothetical protein